MIDTNRILDMVMGATGGPGSDMGSGSVPATRTPYGAADRQPQAGQRGGDLLETAKGFLQSQGGGIAGGAAAGALAGLLMGSKSGRKMAETVVKVGGAAALGALAYKAYSNYRDGRPVTAGIPGADLLTGRTGSASATAAGAGAIGLPPGGELPGAPPRDQHALLLLRAMIAAALSDGVIDAAERDRILGRLDAAGISREEHDFLEREIATPLAPRDFAAAATTPEMRSEVYLASSIAIDADTSAERAYLQYLAATLGLDEALVTHLEAAARAAHGEATAGPRQVA